MIDGVLSAERIWLVLILLTIASVTIGERHLLGSYSGAMVVALAWIKARWVVLDYMEARHAPGPWRHVFDAWLAAGAFIMGIIVVAG